MIHLVNQIGDCFHEPADLCCLRLSINVYHETFPRTYTHVVANGSNWEVNTLEVVVLDDFDPSSVRPDELEGLPLFRREIVPKQVRVSLSDTVSQRVHQNVDFKRFLEVAVKALLLQTVIQPVKTDIPYVDFFSKGLFAELNEDIEHSVFHHVEVEAEGHSGHDVHVDLSLQKGGKQSHDLLFQFVNTVKFFFSIEAKVDQVLFFFEPSDVLSTAIQDLGVDQVALVELARALDAFCDCLHKLVADV